MSLIKNVIFFYVSAGNNPTVRYQEEADPQLAFKNKEYSVSFLIKAEDYKALKKGEGKGISQIVKPKKDFPMDVEAFKEKFKVKDVPKEYLNGDDEVIMLKMSEKSDYSSNGDRNKFRLEIKGIDKSTRTITKTDKGEKVILDEDTQIGNGSLGHVQWEAVAYDNKFGKGVSAKPRKIFVSSLVEFQNKEVKDEFDGEDFDFGEDDDEFDGRYN